MRRLILFISLLLIVPNSLKAQYEIVVNAYKTTEEYNNKTPSLINLKVEVTTQGIGYKKLKKAVHSTGPKTNKKVSLKHVWAFEYQGNTYLNLYYSISLFSPKEFVKIDISGARYAICLLSPHEMTQIESPNYGSGLAGAISEKSDEWNIYWNNSKGDRNLALIIDLFDPYLHRHGNSVASLLSRKATKNEFNLDVKAKELRDMTLEEVLNLIETHNQ